MTSKPSVDRDDHLAPESLGAYLEGRVSAEERQEIQAHLATCADCFDAFAESAEALHAQPPQTRAPQEGQTTPPRRPVAGMEGKKLNWTRTIWLTGLVSAAALTMVTWMGVERFRPSPRQTSEFQVIVSAMRDGRPTEGRLSGELPYGPAPSPTRAGDSPVSQSARLEAAVARVESQLAGDRGAEAQCTLGEALLAVHRVQDAIVVFEAAAARNAGDAALQNDLAAAYLERGIRTSAASDFERALGSVDRARAIASDRPEALFNRALALERLDRRQEAMAAWQEYLARDASSEWAREARERSAFLKSK